ncbi:MAG: tetratricopeptide repeat protein, partial [Chloroflexota bacterium]
GEQGDLLQLLQRETEGNAFFAVEVIRTLAQEMGGLHQIGTSALPTTLLPNGIQTIVERCLARVPDKDHRLLELAAVAGRTLDMAVLQKLSGEYPPDDHWLATCADAAVLEVTDERWQFRHAKIRDGLLAMLPAETTKRHHQRVAEAIEQLYPNNPRYASQLMMHWRHAGHPDQEYTYAYQAGVHAADQYANTEALTYLTRAYDLAYDLASQDLASQDLASQDTAIQQEKRYQTLLMREKLYARIGNATAQKADLDLLTALAHEIGRPEPRTHAALRQASYLMMIGELPTAIAQAQRAVTHAQQANHDPLLIESQSTYGQVLVLQGDFDSAQSIFTSTLALAQQLGEQRDIARLLAHLGHVSHVIGDPQDAIAYFKQSLTMHQALNDVQGEAKAANSLGRMALDLTHYEEAQTYLAQSLKIYQTIGDKQGESELFNSMAALYDVIGDFDASESYLKQALTIYRNTGNKGGISRTINHLGVRSCDVYQYDQAYQYFAEALEIAQEIGDRYGIAIGLSNLGSLFRECPGTFQQAAQNLKQATALARQIDSKELEAGCLMHRGAMYNRLGRYHDAKSLLEQALVMYRELDFRWWEGWALMSLGDCFMGQRQLEQAQTHLRQAFTILHELNHQDRAGIVLNSLAWRAYLLGDYAAMLQHYRDAFANLQYTGHTHAIAESQAGIALAHFLIDNTLSEAEITASIAYAEHSPKLMTSTTPFRLYLLCRQLLAALNDPYEATLLTIAYDRLQTIATYIEDDGWRQSYLDDVPEQREIVRLAESH